MKPGQKLVASYRGEQGGSEGDGVVAVYTRVRGCGWKWIFSYGWAS